MPASNKQTTLRGCGFPKVGCYTLHGSLTSPYKAGFLTSGSSLPFPFSYYVQWDNEKSLLCYSDRIVQDLHLIPSSGCYADYSQHFICSIWNYTDIIITRCPHAVNSSSVFCHFFINIPVNNYQYTDLLTYSRMPRHSCILLHLQVVR